MSTSDPSRIDVTGYPVHPIVAAMNIPTMTHDEYKALVENIRDYGQQQPIVMEGDDIVDGLHRWLACDQLKRKPKTVQWSQISKPGASITEFVLGTLNARRNLDKSQRAMIAARAVPTLTEEAKERSKANLKHVNAGKSIDVVNTTTSINEPVGRSVEVAAREANVSPKTVQRAHTVATKAPDLAAKVDAGAMTVNRAYQETVAREKLSANGTASNGAHAAPGEPDESDLTDDEWLATLPLTKALSRFEHQGRYFQQAALAYRGLESALKSFKSVAQRQLPKNIEEPFGNTVRATIRIKHPREWQLCVKCRGSASVHADTGDHTGKDVRMVFCKCGSGYVLEHGLEVAKVGESKAREASANGR